MLIDPSYLKAKHDTGLTYEQYLHTGSAQQREGWQAVYERTRLTDPQRNLIRGFVRQMNVIVLTGIWCGDCAQQGPLIQRIAEANPRLIDIKWLDRDEHMDLQERVMINAGKRVPVVVFCAEDFEPVGWFGDRTLARYRAIAQSQLGPACPLPGGVAPAEQIAAEQADWVDQFERVHLLLRLSGRLRNSHGD